jgi:CubicO group peptidase (beta-lactamase class C family)
LKKQIPVSSTIEMEATSMSMYRLAIESPLKACAVALLVIGAAVQPVLLQAADVATSAEASMAGFDERLEAAFAELQRKKISTIVGVAHRNRPIVVREFGAAIDDGIPAGVTQVDVNSITKTVTGAMTLKLVAQGKVSLDERLADIFPTVPADKAGITVRHLLTHAAGFVESVGDDEERLSKQDFLLRAFGSPLLSVPGEEYHYSNVGFSVLATIIEERSGKSYDNYLQQDVLANVGLRSTGYMSVYDDARSLWSRRGDTIMTASWGGHEPYWNLIGNGGLISTVEDFIRFRQAFKAGEIVGPELVRDAQRKHIAENEEGMSFYGYGLVVQDFPQLGRIYWHDGGNDIFSAIWFDLIQQGDILLTAAADSRAGDATDALRVLVRHLYGVELPGD